MLRKRVDLVILGRKNLGVKRPCSFSKIVALNTELIKLARNNDELSIAKVRAIVNAGADLSTTDGSE